MTTPREAKRKLQLYTEKSTRRGCYVARWIDPIHGRQRQRTTGCRRKGAAEDVAGQIALEELAKAKAGIPWGEFCDLYVELDLSQKANPRAPEAWHTVEKWVSELGPSPNTVADIDKAWLLRWRARLVKALPSVVSADTYVARLKAALRWAEDHDLIDAAPRIKVPQHNDRRSREVTYSEFLRMLAAAKKVRPKDWPCARLFLAGLYRTGLRLNDLRRLSWDPADPIWLDATGPRPLIRLARGSHKSGKLLFVPPRPEFWELVEDQVRIGLVCEWPGPNGQLARRTVQKIVAQIGKRAKVVTGEGTPKTATAHDLRRSYGKWMLTNFGADAAQTSLGHAKGETTRAYYAQQTAAEIAALMWRD